MDIDDVGNFGEEPKLRTFPSDALRQARALQKSASSYIRKKHLAEARPLLERALEIYADLNCLNSKLALGVSYKLARLNMLLGQPEQAKAIICELLKRMQAPEGPIAEFRFQMALAQITSDKSAPAFEFGGNLTDGSKERNNYLRVFDCLQKYAEICRSTGDLPQAEIALQESQRYKHLQHFFPEDIFVATLLCA